MILQKLPFVVICSHFRLKAGHHQASDLALVLQAAIGLLLDVLTVFEFLCPLIDEKENRIFVRTVKYYAWIF